MPRLSSNVCESQAPTEPSRLVAALLGGWTVLPGGSAGSKLKMLSAMSKPTNSNPQAARSARRKRLAMGATPDAARRLSAWAQPVRYDRTGLSLLFGKGRSKTRANGSAGEQVKLKSSLQ